MTNKSKSPGSGAERTPDWPWGCHDELTLCQLILCPLSQGFSLWGCLCVTVCLQVITSWFGLFEVDNTSIYVSSSRVKERRCKLLFWRVCRPYPCAQIKLMTNLFTILPALQIDSFTLWRVSKCTTINLKMHLYQKEDPVEAEGRPTWSSARGSAGSGQPEMCWCHVLPVRPSFVSVATGGTWHHCIFYNLSCPCAALHYSLGAWQPDAALCHALCARKTRRILLLSFKTLLSADS